MGLADRIATGCGIAGILFHLIGLATPYWSRSYPAGDLGGLGDVFGKVSSYLTGGLDGKAKGGPINDGLWQISWLDTAQTFAKLGLLPGIAAIVLTLVYVLVEQLRKDLFYILAAVGNLSASGCIFMAVVIFATKNTSALSWSFGLSVAGMLFHGIAGTLMVVIKCRNKPE